MGLSNPAMGTGVPGVIGATAPDERAVDTVVDWVSRTPSAWRVGVSLTFTGDPVGGSRSV